MCELRKKRKFPKPIKTEEQETIANIHVVSQFHNFPIFVSPLALLFGFFVKIRRAKDWDDPVFPKKFNHQYSSIVKKSIKDFRKLLSGKDFEYSSTFEKIVEVYRRPVCPNSFPTHLFFERLKEVQWK